MNCPEFISMTPRERSNYIGLLIHAVTNDSTLFQSGGVIIGQAEEKGLFEGVTINPIENKEKAGGGQE